MLIYYYLCILCKKCTGIQYDKFGNKVSWNNKETNEVYDQKVKCFVDQYNNFTLNTTDDDKPIQVRVCNNGDLY